jgi:hypothetical protein
MTNKTRKRAAGGGRKPQGPYSNKLATLSTRITSELRERLDQATEQRRARRPAAPWSLSQEIEQRLRDSLNLEDLLEQQWGAPDVRALAQLVSRIVRSVHSSVGANPFAEAGDLAWHRNPFTHAAVCAAISILLAHYKPEGPVEVPPEVKKRAQWVAPEQGEAATTPISVGTSCALGLLSQMATMQAPAPEKISSNAHYGEGHYALPAIRKILEK